VSEPDSGAPRRRRPAGEDERSQARERALTILYEAHNKGITPTEAAASHVIKVDGLTAELLRGVEEHQPQLDGLIRDHAHNWTIERMPVLDVNILRLAMFELGYRPDVPVAVVIDEAVELAKRFSTDESGRFVNGVLSATAPLLRP